MEEMGAMMERGVVGLSVVLGREPGCASVVAGACDSSPTMRARLAAFRRGAAAFFDVVDVLPAALREVEREIFLAMVPLLVQVVN